MSAKLMLESAMSSFKGSFQLRLLNTSSMKAKATDVAPDNTEAKLLLDQKSDLHAVGPQNDADSLIGEEDSDSDGDGERISAAATPPPLPPVPLPPPPPPVLHIRTVSATPFEPGRDGPQPSGPRIPSWNMTGATVTLGGFKVSEFGIQQTPLNNSLGEHRLQAYVPEAFRSQGSFVQYIRLGIIGHGASSTVYKALHVPTLQIVAIKEIPLYERQKRHQLAHELAILPHNFTSVWIAPPKPHHPPPLLLTKPNARHKPGRFRGGAKTLTRAITLQIARKKLRKVRARHFQTQMRTLQRKSSRSKNGLSTARSLTHASLAALLSELEKEEVSDADADAELSADANEDDEDEIEVEDGDEDDDDEDNDQDDDTDDDDDNDDTDNEEDEHDDDDGESSDAQGEDEQSEDDAGNFFLNTFDSSKVLFQGIGVANVEESNQHDAAHMPEAQAFREADGLFDTHTNLCQGNESQDLRDQVFDFTDIEDDDEDEDEDEDESSIDIDDDDEEEEGHGKEYGRDTRGRNEASAQFQSQKSRRGSAKSFVGTLNYMSPERINGNEYTETSDVWSIGLTCLTLAHGVLPIQERGSRVYWALVSIANGDMVPEAPPPGFSDTFCSFVAECLQIDPARRPRAAQLLAHPFLCHYHDKDATAASFQRKSQVPRAHAISEAVEGFEKGLLRADDLEEIICAQYRGHENFCVPEQPTDFLFSETSETQGGEDNNAAGDNVDDDNNNGEGDGNVTATCATSVVSVPNAKLAAREAYWQMLWDSNREASVSAMSSAASTSAVPPGISVPESGAEGARRSRTCDGDGAWNNKSSNHRLVCRACAADAAKGHIQLAAAVAQLTRADHVLTELATLRRKLVTWRRYSRYEAVAYSRRDVRLLARQLRAHRVVVASHLNLMKKKKKKKPDKK
ncbi:Protein kinase, putative [Hondaea fermentalgiana]|uniref:mitogen-activated protein kinase kinase n=1 Tax=Hondaea fermentalgiana TaxID=2315210 RepID=A0A2R5G8C9_9STRA|nr:Protein kinase, putative [Hondaea fermentalgiana]|eukprot:GBG27312.1 Protein kinase, putative [Hondaea fermentalgiana]